MTAVTDINSQLRLSLCNDNRDVALHEASDGSYIENILCIFDKAHLEQLYSYATGEEGKESIYAEDALPDKGRYELNFDDASPEHIELGYHYKHGLKEYTVVSYFLLEDIQRLIHER